MENTSPRVPAAEQPKQPHRRRTANTAPGGSGHGAHQIYLSVKQIADRLGCSDDSVSRLIDAGELTAINIRATGKGTRLRISEAELERFIVARTLPSSIAQ